MSTPDSPDPSWRSSARWAAGAGMELAATMGGACLLGWWIDRRYATDPWGMVSCAMIGVVGGMYNLIRRAVRDTFRQGGRKSERRSDHFGDPPGDDTGG